MALLVFLVIVQGGWSLIRHPKKWANLVKESKPRPGESEFAREMRMRQGAPW